MTSIELAEQVIQGLDRIKALLADTEKTDEMWVMAVRVGQASERVEELIKIAKSLKHLISPAN